MLESPDNSGYIPTAINLINWTATYRWDSDLVTPYERFTLNELVPADQKPSSGFPRHSELRNFARGKTKKVAWFVSHCSTANRRENYVKALSKFIPVDVYGSCGRLKCSRRNPFCWKMLDSDYKFYSKSRSFFELKMYNP